jgi:integrase
MASGVATWRSVSDIISNAMRRADISDGTAHRLRHYFGSNLGGDGADPADRADVVAARLAMRRWPCGLGGMVGLGL